MNKQYGILMLFSLLVFIASGQNNDSKHTSNNSYKELPTYDSIIAGQLNFDSLINKRMRYYLTQFKSKEDFEKFYGRSTDSMIADSRRDFEQYKQWKTGK
jgi:hypothetical protein